MSAYVHGTDHIDLIVSLAVRVEASFARPNPQSRFGFDAVGLTTSTDSTPIKITPDDLGRLLMVENIASVRQLYPTLDDTPEGIEYDLRVSSYTYRPVPLDTSDLGAHWAVAGLRALRSYDYQSCEHDGWKTSDARAWIEAIQTRLFAHIPGYDQATTWEFTRQDVHAHH